jgi:hypothetical protein
MENKKLILREKFIKKLCREKGWNPENLTTGQRMIIVNKEEYKNPKI